MKSALQIRDRINELRQHREEEIQRWLYGIGEGNKDLVKEIDVEIEHLEWVLE